MKYADVKIGSTLISPYGGEWMVIKKYASDMWLIRYTRDDNLVCLLSGGQVRKGWRVKKDE